MNKRIWRAASAAFIANAVHNVNISAHRVLFMHTRHFLINQLIFFFAAACHEVPYHIWLKVPECNPLHHVRRAVDTSRQQGNGSVAKMKEFIGNNKQYFDFPFIAEPMSLMNLFTGSGVGRVDA